MTFLRDTLVNQTLDTLAKQPRLTIFVGAGTSMEVGFPSWGRLVDRLLRMVAERAKLSDENADEFVTAAWNDEMGILGAGSIVKSQLGSAPDTYIRQALYSVDSRAPKIATQEPGPTAFAIASLLGLWPAGAVEIATTNYDLLLEKALDAYFAEHAAAGTPAFHGDESPQAEPTRARPGRNEAQIGPSGDFCVRHIHGALGPASSSADIKPAVLSEHDFHEVQDAESWQAMWLRERLADTTCLFIGASMTDANVLRFLHIASESGAREHTALIARMDNMHQGRTTPAVELWKEATDARWAEFQVRALYPAYYSDVAAFVDELARRRSRYVRGLRALASDHVTSRLARWHRTVSSRLLPDAGTRFSKAQDKITLLLSRYLGEAVSLIADTPGVADSQFCLQLWKPDAEGEHLVNWGSSQHAWRDPSTLAPIRVEPGTRWLAIETWCQGTPTLMNFAERQETRWAMALGVPIILEGGRWGRLQVAVATFNVMGPHADGLLFQVPPESLSSLVGLIQDALGELLAL